LVFVLCLALCILCGYYCGHAIEFAVKSKESATLARDMVQK
jgi:hypothetical protein